ncbi:ricin-type beta-trefoil lectin domain protein [Streptomyces sp. NPDC051133]|uniref:ricin-type beta-trefoil lectin domain protein n=1 Tax=Streptomyces sp. NPDC051133 TaxID=3155521 RepID=UPI00343730B9
MIRRYAAALAALGAFTLTAYTAPAPAAAAPVPVQLVNKVSGHCLQVDSSQDAPAEPAACTDDERQRFTLSGQGTVRITRGEWCLASETADTPVFMDCAGDDSHQTEWDANNGEYDNVLLNMCLNEKNGKIDLDVCGADGGRTVWEARPIAS